MHSVNRGCSLILALGCLSMLLSPCCASGATAESQEITVRGLTAFNHPGLNRTSKASMLVTHMHHFQPLSFTLAATMNSDGPSRAVITYFPATFNFSVKCSGRNIQAFQSDKLSLPQRWLQTPNLGLEISLMPKHSDTQSPETIVDLWACVKSTDCFYLMGCPIRGHATFSEVKALVSATSVDNSTHPFRESRLRFTPIIQPISKERAEEFENVRARPPQWTFYGLTSGQSKPRHTLKHIMRKGYLMAIGG